MNKDQRKFRKVIKRRRAAARHLRAYREQQGLMVMNLRTKKVRKVRFGNKKPGVVVPKKKEHKHQSK